MGIKTRQGTEITIQAAQQRVAELKAKKSAVDPNSTTDIAILETEIEHLETEILRETTTRTTTSSVFRPASSASNPNRSLFQSANPSMSNRASVTGDFQDAQEENDPLNQQIVIFQYDQPNIVAAPLSTEEITSLQAQMNRIRVPLINIWRPWNLDKVLDRIAFYIRVATQCNQHHIVQELLRLQHSSQGRPLLWLKCQILLFMEGPNMPDSEKQALQTLINQMERPFSNFRGRGRGFRGRARGGFRGGFGRGRGFQPQQSSTPSAPLYPQQRRGSQNFS